MTATRRIEIYDTTLRDGTQGEGFNLSLQDKLLIAQKLDELGVDYIEGGFPLSNPKDAAFFRDVRDLKLRHAKVAAFGKGSAEVGWVYDEKTHRLKAVVPAAVVGMFEEGMVEGMR